MPPSMALIPASNEFKLTSGALPWLCTYHIVKAHEGSASDCNSYTTRGLRVARQARDLAAHLFNAVQRRDVSVHERWELVSSRERSFRSRPKPGKHSKRTVVQRARRRKRDMPAVTGRGSCPSAETTKLDEATLIEIGGHWPDCCG